MTGVRVYVGLGANLGDRGEALLQALRAMAALPQTQLLAVSSLYSSAPVDATGPDYLNAVAALQTQQSPEAFLQALQTVELAAGRERPYRNAPRTLDLDILLWGNAQLDTPALTVPHLRMYERAFVLLPLAQLDASLVRADQLAAVADQRIAVAQDADWAASALQA
ncbi:2-amino-4-hydroxy-6-hydroxymethyldihydropteridine diphosphokinase [Comamonas aquatica]|uniref:2-amino-4-hydroxy-6- hydroxymethyldihydropteridine diphosphokinase n=1 Tax=Comamonas jiangduensis TaxID=1194168 RepID=UPI001581FE7C|nr:2-amino-4-hydroxy-6-hydroxymethyldihydropteridine diphosphokinase [Comamonas jiangduensis]QXW17529.1 2-amino-4-hydroxy-6-hydroxymethyldihydropteridine diphosphokinase [Comamonas aquatica]